MAFTSIPGGTGVKFSVRSEIKRARAKLARVQQTLDERKLLAAMGLEVLNWINKNFRAEGLEQPWAPLSSSTLANPRRGGSARILRDTGRLEQSFVVPRAIFQVTNKEVTVGSRDPRAEWHHFGTRPFTIRPVNKRVLRFFTAQGETFAREVRHPGLPARPILPTKGKATELAVSVIRAAVKLKLRGNR